jgi:hypothetical protein
MTRTLTLALSVALATPTLAQDFNVDFGEPGAGPPSTYAAAGRAGFWNSIRAEHTTPATGPQAIDYALLDVDGNATGVGLHQFGGQSLILVDDPTIAGDDATLLEDALVTHSIPLKSCLYFNGLTNGTYEVLMYTWMPNHPETQNVSFIDFTPSMQLAGGAWGGSHAKGLTYSRFLVHVTTGFMGPHAGIPDGGSTLVGGALNGIQLRKLTCAGCTLFCHGNGGATACPCGNEGDWGKGCDNSFGTGGGELAAEGTPSVAADDVLLTVRGLPPTTVVLFFQGTSAAGGGLGTVFGDGLLCASGTVRRLGARFTSGGTASFGAGDGTPSTLVSVRGQLPPTGGTRTYQGWYRNQAAAFCNAERFNLTNGLEIPWAP